jgi:hypothetical protein
MSDDADRAQWRIEQDLRVAMAHARAVPALSGHGACHFCDEPVALEALFCGSDCRDDYDREAAARRRAGVNAG